MESSCVFCLNVSEESISFNRTPRLLPPSRVHPIPLEGLSLSSKQNNGLCQASSKSKSYPCSTQCSTTTFIVVRLRLGIWCAKNGLCFKVPVCLLRMMRSIVKSHRHRRRLESGETLNSEVKCRTEQDAPAVPADSLDVEWWWSTRLFM